MAGALVFFIDEHEPYFQMLAEDHDDHFSVDPKNRQVLLLTINLGTDIRDALTELLIERKFDLLNSTMRLEIDRIVHNLLNDQQYPFESSFIGKGFICNAGT